MKYLIPIVAMALGIGIGFLGGRITAPTNPGDVFDSAPPDPEDLGLRQAQFGNEAAAFVTWYETNGGDASVSEAMLREHLGILRREAREHRLVPELEKKQAGTSEGK